MELGTIAEKTGQNTRYSILIAGREGGSAALDMPKLAHAW
jgi:hypothetical protein